MVLVKICGITCGDDVRLLNRYLPDFTGFILAESRRRVMPEAARIMAGGLAGTIKKVGVFVNTDLEELAGTASYIGLDAVQLHGEESPEFIRQLRLKLGSGIEIWKALRVKDKCSLADMDEYKADRIMLDAYVEGAYGGSGRTFDWDIAAAAAEHRSIVLAGGLNPENVCGAIEKVRPFAVDASSGVESDGFKNESKIRDFIQNVRQMQENSILSKTDRED